MVTKNGDWIFEYKDFNLKMNENEINDYQKKLLELKEKYHDKCEHLSNCDFYSGELPPSDNIFASFTYKCKRHTPRCNGWFLIWDPNNERNRDKLKSCVNNRCATWEFKSLSKKIQNDLIEAFPKYFEKFDDDDTHPYYSDSFYSMKYGCSADEDEVPDYTSYSLDDKYASFGP